MESEGVIDSGQGFCSGAMVNNTCLDFTPYLLTADHCLDPSVNNWVFRFQYRSPNPRCDGQGGGANNPINIFYNGAVVRANRWQTDFALLELNTQPSHSDLSYLGWSRTTTGITSTAGIHHPSGDLMKISIDNAAPVPVAIDVVVEDLTYPAGNLWEVDFDIGTVEGGSSGSPLLDQNRRLIGQFFAFIDANRCVFTDGLYGRLDVSWDAGGTAATRLRDWLDPNNTGVMTTNTVPVPSITGPDRICTSAADFTLGNVPTGTTVTWAVSPIHLFPTAGRSGTGTTASLQAWQNNTSGSATLTFTVQTASCGSYQVQKQIWVGVPDAGTKIVPNYQPVCINEYTYFNAFYDMLGNGQPGNQEADITSFVWTPPSGVPCFTAGTKNEVLGCQFTPAHAGFPQPIYVRAVNSCGQGAMSYANFTPTYCYYFSVGINPNPARGRVSIELTETPLDEEARAVLASERKGTGEYQEYSFDTPPQRIRIFDITGVERLCMEEMPEGTRHELDIGHLGPGVFVVHLEHRNGTVVRQLRVE